MKPAVVSADVLFEAYRTRLQWNWLSGLGASERRFDEVAVRAARQAGAQFVIAVDVSARAGKAPAGTSSALLERDARRRSRIDPETSLADFVIHPDMAYAASPLESYFVQAQMAGEAEAGQLLPELMRKMSQAGVR